MFCWHKWKVKEKIKEKSVVEKADDANMKITDGLIVAMFINHYIVTYHCGKCGAEKVDRV